MVEVVQRDLLDQAAYAGGAGHRRLDPVQGIGAGTPAPSQFDWAIVGKRVGDNQEQHLEQVLKLGSDEVLDGNFEQKTYPAQLREFAFRGDHLIKQIDATLGEVQRLARRGFDRKGNEKLSHLLQAASDELRHAHILICDELEVVWHLRFKAFFYPPEVSETEPEDESDETVSLQAACPSSWLDLDDMFLTMQLLTRYIAELVKLVTTAVRYLPGEVLECREKLASRNNEPAMRPLIEAFAARVPWLGVMLPLSDSDTPPRGASVPSQQDAPLNRAISALDSVLTVKMQELLVFLQREMYRNFVRACAGYERWKHAARAENQGTAQAGLLAARLGISLLQGSNKVEDDGSSERWATCTKQPPVANSSNGNHNQTAANAGDVSERGGAGIDAASSTSALQDMD